MTCDNPTNGFDVLMGLILAAMFVIPFVVLAWRGTR